MSFNLTDIIYSILIISFILHGWHRGFLRTLLGPLALILGLICAFIYFKKTQDIQQALILSIAGPILFLLIFSWVIYLWNKNVDKELPPQTLSRAFGAAVSVLWGTSMFGMTLILFTILPPELLQYPLIQKNIFNSGSYVLAKQYLKPHLPFILKTEKMIQAFHNPQTEALTSQPEFQQLIKNEKIQSALTDPVVSHLLEERDVGRLLLHSKIKNIWQDHGLMEQLIKVAENASVEKPPEKTSKTYTLGSSAPPQAETTPPAPSSPGPRVYRLP